MAAGKKTGGRKKGTPNKRTAAVSEAALAVVASVTAEMPDVFEGDAHALLMLVYKDQTKPIELRLDAAGKAIKFEKPVLAALDVTSRNEHLVHTVSDKPVSPEEWAAEHGTTAH